MIDMKALYAMSYGLYIVSTKYGDELAGCVVNTMEQVTAEPVKFAVAIHKDNCTTRLIEKSGVFTGTILSQTATMELIGRFGFRSSKEFNKFEKIDCGTDSFGLPYVREQAVAYVSCKVVDKLDLGTHILFVGEVREAEMLCGSCVPMTYAYYHKVKKGLTPPKASSYQAKPKKGYRCAICGYVLESDTIPDDFVCPVCGLGKEHLQPIE